MAESAPLVLEIITSQTSPRGWYGRVGVLLAIILVVPIWLVDYPPLVDYPNHLARGYILYHYDDVPGFAEQFEIDWWTPSLAMDLFMLGGQMIGDVRLAGKVFLTLTLWLWLLGWHWLGCAIHGEPTWLALGGALVAYTSMFLYGFTNYSFGLGMFLVASAAWLRWRANWNWRRFLLLAFLSVACYFSHLSAFIFLYGTVSAVTLWDLYKRRTNFRTAVFDFLPLSVAFMVPMIVFLHGSGGAPAPEWDLRAKLVGVLCLFRGYHRHIDADFIAAVAVFLILLGIWAVRVRANGGVLFAGLGCVFMFLIGPQVIFGGSPADARFLPAAAALVTLSLDLTIPRKKALMLLGIFLALVIFRCAMIGAFWQSFQPDLRQQVELFEWLPRDAKVYPMVNVPEQPEEQKLGTASFHMIHYAVIDRHIVTPHLLAYPGQQPIRYRTSPITFHNSADHFPALAEVAWPKVFATYDFVWCWNLPDVQRRFLQRRCELVAEDGNGSIWRVKKAE